MKKIVLLILIFIICGCTNTTQLTKSIEVEGNCEIIKEIDNHGGFLGDGESFIKLKCDSVKLSDNWKDLPLTSELNKTMESIWCLDKCQNAYERYNIPNIINGSYIFIDRHSESTNKYDDSLINERVSYNYTLALFDKDTNTIYYFEMDT